jgi:hypothetical protein
MGFRHNTVAYFSRPFHHKLHHKLHLYHLYRSTIIVKKM